MSQPLYPSFMVKTDAELSNLIRNGNTYLDGCIKIIKVHMLRIVHIGKYLRQTAEDKPYLLLQFFIVDLSMIPLLLNLPGSHVNMKNLYSFVDDYHRLETIILSSIHPISDNRLRINVFAQLYM